MGQDATVSEVPYMAVIEASPPTPVPQMMRTLQFMYWLLSQLLVLSVRVVAVALDTQPYLAFAGFLLVAVDPKNEGSDMV